MSATTVTPKVWIGCLASYNAGRLIGEWVDATDLDGMYECRDRVAARAVAAAKEVGDYPVYFGEPEEFFLADYEGFPRDSIGEYTPLARVAELAAALEEHGEPFVAYLALGIHQKGAEVGEIVEAFQEAYVGEFDSLTDYAETYVSEVGWNGVPAGELRVGDSFSSSTVNPIEQLASVLDYEAIGRDLGFSGYSEQDGHIFRSY